MLLLLLLLMSLVIAVAVAVSVSNVPSAYLLRLWDQQQQLLIDIFPTCLLAAGVPAKPTAWLFKCEIQFGSSS